MKWLIIVVIVLASVGASMWMLDAMNIIDLRDIALDALLRIPGFEERLETYRLGEEARQIIDRQARDAALLQAELAVARHELELEREALRREKDAVTKEWERLAAAQKELEAREARLLIEAQSAADFERLQRLYAQMRPRDVAPIIAELEDSVVARLLAGMAIDRAAAILAELPPDRAALLSAAIGGIPSP